MFKLTSDQQNLLNVLCAHFVVVHSLSYFNVHTNEISKSQDHTYVLNNSVDITFLEDNRVVLVYNLDEYEESILYTNQVTVDIIKDMMNTDDE